MCTEAGVRRKAYNRIRSRSPVRKSRNVMSWLRTSSSFPSSELITCVIDRGAGNGDSESPSMSIEFQEVYNTVLLNRDFVIDVIIRRTSEEHFKLTFLAIPSLIFASKWRLRDPWWAQSVPKGASSIQIGANLAFVTLIHTENTNPNVPHHINILRKNAFVDLTQWHKIFNHVNDRTRRIRTRCLIRRQPIRISNKQIHIRRSNDNCHGICKSQDRSLMKWCIVNKKHTSQ